MTVTRRRVLSAVAVVAVAVGGYFAFRPADPSRNPRVAAVGSTAPRFSTFSLTGESVRLADVLEDGPVVLNFWASWCVPCRDEFPMLARVHGRDGVTVLGVIFRDSAEDARQFMKSQGATWPGLLDPQSRIADAYDVHQRPGIPVTYVIGRDGVVRGKHFGPLTQADLDRLLAAVR